MSSRLAKLLSKYSYPTSKAQNLHPSLIQAVQTKPKLIEIKSRLNSSSKSFSLENWYHTNEICVGRWLPTKSMSYQMPMGSYSWGVWRKDYPLGAYRIHDPYGNLIAYRFDVLKDVHMTTKDGNDIIQFSDLIVDLWLWPNLQEMMVTTHTENGNGHDHDSVSVEVEDFDEFQEFLRANLVTAQESQLVQEIIDDVKLNPQKYTELVDNSITLAVNLMETKGNGS